MATYPSDLEIANAAQKKPIDEIIIIKNKDMIPKIYSSIIEKKLITIAILTITKLMKPMPKPS